MSAEDTIAEASMRAEARRLSLAAMLVATEATIPGRVAFVARVADELLDRLGPTACELTEQPGTAPQAPRLRR